MLNSKPCCNTMPIVGQRSGVCPLSDVVCVSLSLITLRSSVCDVRFRRADRVARCTRAKRRERLVSPLGLFTSLACSGERGVVGVEAMPALCSTRPPRARRRTQGRTASPFGRSLKRPPRSHPSLRLRPRREPTPAGESGQRGSSAAGERAEGSQGEASHLLVASARCRCFPSLWERCARLVFMRPGHLARALADHPTGAVMRWRSPPSGGASCRGTMGEWRHTRTNWHRGPDDSVTAILGPQSPVEECNDPLRLSRHCPLATPQIAPPQPGRTG